VKRDRRLLAAVIGAVATVALLLTIWVGLVAALAWAPLAPDKRDALSELLGPSLPAAVVALLVILGLVAVAVPPLCRRWVDAPARLLEQARVLVAGDAQRELEVSGSNADVRGLAQLIGELVRQRAQLRGDVAAQVQEASRNVEQERSRLAALMSELTQSVVVCNMDGRVLLYNNRARVQFRTLSQSPALAAGAELIGLGRSIYAVFDRKLVAHALENIEHRLQRGVADPSAQFVTTTRAGQLLRVQVAPVRNANAEPDQEAVLNGFVLMLDNITSDFEQESARDRLLHGLTEGSRASLGSMQAAVEVLDDPELDTSMRERFHGVIREEVHAMSGRIRTLAAQAVQQIKTRWPLEDMLGTDLVAAAQRRIEAAVELRAATAEVNDTVWLKVDSFSMLQALAYLAGRLAEEYDIKVVWLRLTPADRRAHLDLVWSGQAISTEALASWETDPMRVGSEIGSLSVRDIVQRHGGEFWFERDRARQQAFFRFLLPLASAQQELDSPALLQHAGRPEFYDFDLFQATELSRELDEHRLTDLSYTVFDTETTGLDPSAGDEIIQIGATRLVNGKLLKGECFEQLVDPRRPIAEASIPIHGITPDMVVGQPTIGEVLPAFHAFAQDTVLVAHNAAFDMRFLQLKEATSGVRFEQPVLDTLLLSALMHPNQESHRLEAIAERFGVTVTGRHTALGDAMVTAEIFLKLLPLLAEMGIHTLGQAREATQQTYYARIKY
jgi:DNA polymerase III subunit epsilon